MRSRRKWGISLVALLFAVSVPALAQGPAAVVCREIRNDIDHYYTSWQQGGTPRQMEVWKKLYVRNIWKYGNANCPKYLPNHKRNVAGSSGDVKPAARTGQHPGTAERQQAAL
jgi:hypothetical protein